MYVLQSKLNCEVLYDNLAFEVRWAVAGESIVLQLVAKLGAREYMSFGLSGDDSRSVMVGGDVGVAWIDKDSLKGYVEDYYLAAKAQCSGPTGSCPDNRLEENTNNIRLLNAAMVNGYSIVTYQRPLIASDRFDHEIYTNRSQAIIWAIGPLNQRDEVSFHSHYLKTNSFIDFGRPAKWNCPMPESEQPVMRNVQSPLQTRSKIVTDEEIPIPPPPQPEVTEIRPRQNERRRGGTRGANRQQLTAASQEDDSERSASNKSREQQTRTRGGNRGGQRVQNSVTKSNVPPPTPVEKKDAWKIPPIQCYEPEDGVFYAQMGPTGGKRGYPAITGHVGWGISWYINGLLIPEINVVRGKTYTFVVEGGTDPEISAKYHPFYITDDPVGGYEYKTSQEKDQIRIFAGVETAKDGSVQPVGTGRLCHWTQTGDLEADDFESFGAYQRTLELKCDQGEPGVIQWTPDKDTPDTVYYQCFTHRHLGWKINVHDSCDQSPAASEIKSTSVEAPEDIQEFADKSDIELDESPSIQVETRVKPNDILQNYAGDLTPSQLIVSEHGTNPYQVDPSTTQEQPETLPLIMQQNPSFMFDPIGQYFAQSPYTFDNLYNFHYNKKKQFKPSLLLNTESETTTTQSSVTTTTSRSTTTTVKMTTPDTTTTSTTKKPIEKTINAVISSYSNVTETFMTPPLNFPPIKFIKMPNKPPNYSKRHTQPKYPMKTLMRRPPPPLLPRRKPQQMIHKKPIFRPLNKPHRPNKQKKRPSSPKAQLIPSVHWNSFPLHKNPLISETSVTKAPVKMNVKLSPQQASTEREPELQTASSLIDTSKIKPIGNLPTAHNTSFKQSTINFKPTKPEVQKESSIIYISPIAHNTGFQSESVQQLNHLNFKQKETEFQSPSSLLSIEPITKNFVNWQIAHNSGFKPETVVVESGFKPMASNTQIDRADTIQPEIQAEGQVGVIHIKNKNKIEMRPIQNFEPMFVPSPTEKPKLKLTKIYNLRNKKPYKIIIKARSLTDSPVEPIASAAERIDSYYLPPRDNTEKPIDVVRRPSNIDFEPPTDVNLAGSPPDVVVTFDGKKVSGASLTAKPFERSNLFDPKASKASQLLRARPQFVPYRGELPPLDPAYFDKNAPQLQSTQVGVLSRDLDTPILPPQETTRLRRVRREPHHTPEHTAQQEEERRNSTQTNSVSLLSANSSLVFLVAFLQKYL